MLQRRCKWKSDKLFNPVFSEHEIIKLNTKDHWTLIVIWDFGDCASVCWGVCRCHHWRLWKLDVTHVPTHILLCEKFRIARLFKIKFVNLGCDGIISNLIIIDDDFYLWRCFKRLISWNRSWVIIIQCESSCIVKINFIWRLTAYFK